MATDVEKLVVALEARTKSFENALVKANSAADRKARAIEKRFLDMNKNITASFVSFSRGVVGVLAGSAITRELLQLSESATRIDNSLKVAGLSGAELERVYQRLAAAAKANGAPIETLVGLYSKASQNQKELGVTSEELLKFTSNVALALRVAGTDAQTASGALLQLGQALGSGRVQAEEFNSILEGAPTIAQAMAIGLKEAGGSVSQLKKLVIDGKLSSEAAFRAFEAGAVTLQEKAAKSTMTVAQAATNLRTALIDVVREFNNSTGASERFARGINFAADAIGDFDVSGLIQKIRDARTELDDYLASLGNAQVFKDLATNLGALDANGDVVNLDASKATEEASALDKEIKLLQQRIELNTQLGFDNTDAIARLNEVQAKLAQVQATAANIAAEIPVPGANGGNGLIEPVPSTTNGQMGGSSIRGGARRRVVKPVSLANFNVPGGSTSSRSGGGGGRNSQDEYQREVQQIKERTAAMQAETAAMAQLNPLVNDFGYSLDYARTRQDLLTAAQQAGVKVTPEVEASINAMAQGYATATSAAERLQATQEKVREQAEFFGQAAYDAFSEIIPQIETGNKALDKFLNTLIEAVAQAAILGKGPFAAPGGGGIGGGLLGGIFSLFGFAKGGIAARGRPLPLPRFAKGGIARSASIFGEAGPEAAVPLPDGRRIPVDLRGPSAPAGGSSDVVTVNLMADKSLIADMVDQQFTTKGGTLVKIAVGQSTQQVMPTIAKHQTQKAGGDYRL